MAITLTWEIIDEQNQAMELAWSKAFGAWEKEMAVRRWDAINGGIYVTESENMQPDPYLSGVPDRDITTPSGRKLTLVGPASIIQNIQKMSGDQFGTHGHISSLHPISPSNQADPWEKKILEGFEKGQTEAWTVESMDGERFMRFMRPLFTESVCLQCHEEQVHKVGELRGGLSVSIPMSTVWPAERSEIIRRILGYGGMWILGLCGLTIMARRLKNQINRRYQAEQELQQANVLLEQRVSDRTAELADANRLLQTEITDRKQAESWLLESERRFRGYFEQGLVGMAIMSVDFNWVEVNQRLCKMLGYSEEELVIKRWKDLTHHDDWPAEESHFKQMMEKLVSGYTMEKRFVRKDKKIIPANLSVQCMRREDGSVDCILVLVQEIKAS